MISTLGLSNHELLLRDGVTRGRQELLMLVDSTISLDPFANILYQVGAERIQQHEACLQGDVLGPRGKLLDNSSMSAIYCASPVYFPDEFRWYTKDNVNILMLWLIPITDSESEYIKGNGWRAFEGLLANMEPNLTDPHRQSVV
jgi:Suppressor of fused protein (SUFU)